MEYALDQISILLKRYTSINALLFVEIGEALVHRQLYISGRIEQ